ncbi:MAG: hypothetical protein ACRCUE_10215 [Bosea sp. (in: a-proteobacteria)]
MWSSVRTRQSFIQRCVIVVPLVLAAAACTPDKELDLASPVASSVDGIHATAAAPTYASTTSPGSGMHQKPVRSSRTVPVQPQREPVYYIEFRSRSAASYGHTFASVGKLDASGNIETSEIVGLHPATESPIPWMIGHILPVPSETGASDGDLEEKYWTARYRVRMNQQRYDAVMSDIRKLQSSSPAWHAVFYNCNAFVGDVAKLMGLKAPANSMLFPKEYIEELASVNGA